MGVGQNALASPRPAKKKRERRKRKKGELKGTEKKVKRRGNRSFAVNPANNVWRRVGAEMTLPPPPPPPPSNLKEREGREGKGKEERKGKKKREIRKVGEISCDFSANKV